LTDWIRRSLGFCLLLGSATLAASCRLTEVALPAGSDVLVVEAILRVGARQQYVLLHRSMEGRTIRGETGAYVFVTPAHAATITFYEAPLRECLTQSPDNWSIPDVQVDATCYLSPVAAGRFVHSGAEYELLVETERGERVRGRTRVPGSFGFRSPSVSVNPNTLSVSCELPTRPFTLAWSRSLGAWSYLTSLHISGFAADEDLRSAGIDVPDPLELTGVSVSATDTTLLFPANLGLFQRADYDQRLFQLLQQGLPAGLDVIFVILAGDQNFTNGIRGGRFNPSGNVRSSSVIGDGVGVFGSVVPLQIRSSRGANEPPLPPCPVPQWAY
jgi:hypothetical protein